MKFIAEVDIMPMKEILDPQGKAVKLGLQNLEVQEVADVRIGKHVVLHLEADSEKKAKEIVENACKKLLVNLIMEEYKYQIKTAE